MDATAKVSDTGRQGTGSGLTLPFENTYARLPEAFHERVRPTPVRAPRLLALNVGLARGLGMDAEALRSAAGVAVLAGNAVAEGSEPLAMAYAGHQFGYFVPQLGDGRANLLGEVRGTDGVLYDVQLKGSGPTRFSRRGDGRAAIGPVLREYLVSEAMFAMGVPTTRSLAAVATGEAVVRETMVPGAVLTRVAQSHLRVGTFQYFAAQEDHAGLRVLAEYAMARHYPEAAGSERPMRALLEGVVGRHARLVAQWMCLGFVHGVMNTDNTSISGETLDYGPCAFLEAYDPRQVFSSIDRQGRYGFANQPHAAHWNLTRLAESLLPLLAEETGSEQAAVESATEALGTFADAFDGAYLAGMRRKLGLLEEREGDAALVQALLDRMAEHAVDFTELFWRLTEAAEDVAAEDEVRAMFGGADGLGEWVTRWRARLAEEGEVEERLAERGRVMRRANPVYIPRNHLVEEALRGAERGDLGLFEQMLEVVTHPFVERPGWERYARPARPEERVRQTFCGT